MARLESITEMARGRFDYLGHCRQPDQHSAGAWHDWRAWVPALGNLTTHRGCQWPARSWRISPDHVDRCGCLAPNQDQ